MCAKVFASMGVLLVMVECIPCGEDRGWYSDWRLGESGDCLDCLCFCLCLVLIGWWFGWVVGVCIVVEEAADLRLVRCSSQIRRAAFFAAIFMFARQAFSPVVQLRPFSSRGW